MPVILYFSFTWCDILSCAGIYYVFWKGIYLRYTTYTFRYRGFKFTYSYIQLRILAFGIVLLLHMCITYVVIGKVHAVIRGVIIVISGISIRTTCHVCVYTDISI